MTSSIPLLDDHGDLETEYLVRYWLGQSPLDQSTEIRTWLDSHPEQHVRYERMRSAIEDDEWIHLTSGEISTRVSQTLQVITPGTAAVEVPRRRGSSPRILGKDRLVRLVPGAGYIIATMAVCLLSFAAGMRINPYRPWGDSGNRILTYATAKGERATVTLPDGSTVTLNVDSQLDIPLDYGRNKREVSLSGEALFDVTHADQTPFLVIAGRTTTRVLGTSFVVRRYQTDTAATIAVRAGKVSVMSVVLSAGYETIVGATGIPYVRFADPTQFEFADGLLTVNNKRFIEIIPLLNRWYDVDIRIADPTLSTRRVIGSFESGSIADLKSILELTFGVRVVREGRVLTLYLRG